MRYLILLLFFVPTILQAQVLKKLARKVQNDAEWRIRSKADQQVSRGLDSLIEAPGKKKRQKNAAGTNNTTATETNPSASNTQPGAGMNAQASGDDMTPKDGFVTVVLSANSVFAGGTIIISGESVNY